MELEAPQSSRMPYCLGVACLPCPALSSHNSGDSLASVRRALSSGTYCLTLQRSERVVAIVQSV
ncbi:hypothetical protein INR49_006172 [Caranx melampygus]|nr:hypothetical protein INR49_006172 [Caranx melampygus]